MFYLSVYEILYMYIIVSISNTIEKNDERLLPESIDSREKKKTKIYFAQLHRENEWDRERMEKKGQFAIDFGQVQRAFW